MQLALADYTKASELMAGRTDAKFKRAKFNFDSGYAHWWLTFCL